MLTICYKYYIVKIQMIHMKRATNEIDDNTIRKKEDLPYPFKRVLPGLNIFNLKTLKTILNLSSNFDFLDFNVVVSEIMMFVSIKEGVKILKSLKYSFERKCETHASLTIYKIHVWRSRILMFKIIFDAFIIKISEKLYIDLTERSVVKKFDKEVKSFSVILENIIYCKIHVTEACLGIKTLLNKPFKPCCGGDEIDKFLYERYYLVDPILHMFSLFNYNISLQL